MVGKILVEVGKAVLIYSGKSAVDKFLNDDTGNKKNYRHGNNPHQKNFGKKSYSRNGKH